MTNILQFQLHSRIYVVLFTDGTHIQKVSPKNEKSPILLHATRHHWEQWKWTGFSSCKARRFLLKYNRLIYPWVLPAEKNSVGDG